MANKYIQKYGTTAEYEAATKGNPNVSFVVETNKIYYNGDEHQIPIPPSKQYLTFKAIDDCTFRVRYNSFNYSVDNGQTWVSLASNTDTPTVSAGNKIMWKRNGNASVGFLSTGRFDVEGNVMSIVSGDSFTEATTVVSSQFYNLFSGCTGLTSAENLVLPVTTLAQNCYDSMFNGCTSLTTAPELPAKTLANYCYQTMFAGCTSLTTAPQLPATTLANSCYSEMFQGCTSLTTAPQLPATTLVSYCYNSMFRGCTSLNSVTCLATNISANSCTIQWLNNVSSTGTFTKAASMTGWSTGNNGIPSGWTVADA